VTAGPGHALYISRIWAPCWLIVARRPVLSGRRPEGEADRIQMHKGELCFHTHPRHHVRRRSRVPPVFNHGRRVDLSSQRTPLTQRRSALSKVASTSDQRQRPPVDRELFGAVQLSGRSGFERVGPNQFCAIS
jgi:hypothetical protein